jgi:hypothetical protein
MEQQVRKDVTRKEIEELLEDEADGQVWLWDEHL